MLIGEGTDIRQISQFDECIAPGQVFEVQLLLENRIDPLTLNEVRKELTSGGVNPLKISQDAGNTLHIRLRKPAETRVGLIWWLPLLAVGGILAGIFGWKIVTMDPMEFFARSLPFLLVGAGIVFLIVKAAQEPEVRRAALEYLPKRPR